MDRTRVSTTEIIEQRPGHAWLQLVRHAMAGPQGRPRHRSGGAGSGDRRPRYADRAQG